MAFVPPSACHHAPADHCHLCVKFAAATRDSLDIIDLDTADADRIVDSSISTEVALARGYKTARSTQELADAGFAGFQQLAPGLLIPIRNVVGRTVTYQLRPTAPRNGRNGKPLKYETPMGTKMVIDVPSPALQWIKDPKRPLIITEGSRKADAAVSRGLCCVALLGVWNFRGVNEHGGKTAIPDFEQIAFTERVEPKKDIGRPVIICFDSDVMQKREVYTALVRIKQVLELYGADVHFAFLPDSGDGKTGLDDALAGGLTVDQFFGLATKTLREFPDGDESQQAEKLQQSIDIIRDRMPRIREARGAGIDEDAFLGACALVIDHDKAEWSRVEVELTQAKVPKRALKDAIKEYQRQHGMAPSLRVVGPDERQGVSLRATLKDDTIPDYHIPDGFFLTPTHIGTKIETEMGVARKPFAGCPMYVYGILQSLDTIPPRTELRLNWKWPGATKWATHIVDRGQAMRAGELEKLASIDFPVSSENRSEFVKYIESFESLNRPSMLRAKSTGRMGWHEIDSAPTYLAGLTTVDTDGEVISTDDQDDWQEGRTIQFRGPDEGERQTVQALQQKGTLAEWQSAISKVLDVPNVMVGVYASFAPPLIHILQELGEDVENFIVSYSGETSKGKTTTMKIASSVWGKPSTGQGGAVGTWKSTSVGLERRAILLNDLPIYMDETQHATRQEDVVAGIYLYSGGQGKGRGSRTGMAKTGFWRSVMLMTGEKPSTGFEKEGGNGGTKVRAIEIQGEPFAANGRAADEMSEVVNGHVRDVLKAYGLAGPEFVSNLIKSRESWTSYQVVYQRFIKELSKGGSRGAGRLAKHAALIELAAFLAHKFKVMPGEYTRVFLNKPIWSEVTHEADDACSAEESLRKLYNYCLANQSKFISERTDGLGWSARLPSMQLSTEIVGRWDANMDWKFIAINPNIFESFIAPKVMNLSHRAVLNMWKSRGWIQVDGKNMAVKVAVQGGKPRMIKVLRSAVDQMCEADQSEDSLPFNMAS